MDIFCLKEVNVASHHACRCNPGPLSLPQLNESPANSFNKELSPNPKLSCCFLALKTESRLYLF